MMLFTAILAAWVSGVAGAAVSNPQGGAGKNFLKIHVTGEELLRLCVKKVNAAFAEISAEAFLDTEAHHPPEAFLAGKSAIRPENVYPECLKFMDEIEVPEAEKAAFEKLRELLKASSQSPIDLWEQPPSMQDIAYPTLGVYKRVLRSDMSTIRISAILVLTAANEVLKRGTLETPLALSIVAEVEFLNGIYVPGIGEEKRVQHLQMPPLMIIVRNCIRTVGKAVQEATGIDEKIIRKMTNGYSNKNTRPRSFDKGQQIVDKAFNVCFNFTDELYDFPKLFTDAQKIKLAELQAKLIFMTHPNMEIADAETGMSEILMDARLGVQAARSIVGDFVRGSLVSKRHAVYQKSVFNWGG